MKHGEWNFEGEAKWGQESCYLMRKENRGSVEYQYVEKKYGLLRATIIQSYRPVRVYQTSPRSMKDSPQSYVILTFSGVYGGKAWRREERVYIEEFTRMLEPIKLGKRMYDYSAGTSYFSGYYLDGYEYEKCCGVEAYIAKVYT